MQMLNFYENRAGKNLSAERKHTLERAKELLHDKVEEKRAHRNPRRRKRAEACQVVSQERSPSSPAPARASARPSPSASRRRAPSLVVDYRRPHRAGAGHAAEDRRRRRQGHPRPGRRLQPRRLHQPHRRRRGSSSAPATSSSTTPASRSPPTSSTSPRPTSTP